MKRIKRYREEFSTPEGGCLIVRHTAHGEPYREGYEFEICEHESWGDNVVSAVMLDERELRRLRDYLNKILA